MPPEAKLLDNDANGQRNGDVADGIARSALRDLVEQVYHDVPDARLKLFHPVRGATRRRSSITSLSAVRPKKRCRTT